MCVTVTIANNLWGYSFIATIDFWIKICIYKKYKYHLWMEMDRICNKGGGGGGGGVNLILPHSGSQKRQNWDEVK